jgi:hypothetical protein
MGTAAITDTMTLGSKPMSEMPDFKSESSMN